MNYFDFSCKHDILIKNPDGSLTSMDEPWFRSEEIAPGTWKVLSDGDFTYVLEGDEETLVIDSGYGCGNIREYCQSLTDKPIRRIANTHDHFDHTANNGRFEEALMSESGAELATIPFPSFEGVNFPRDYKKVVLHEGDIIDLKGRELQVFEIPCHAVSSLAFLDRKQRILFSGDEFGEFCNLSGTIEQFKKNLEKVLEYRHEFDRIATGGGVMSISFLDGCLDVANRILAGEEGEEPRFPPRPKSDPNAPVIYERKGPRFPDMPKEHGVRKMFHGENCHIIYSPDKIYG